LLTESHLLLSRNYLLFDIKTGDSFYPKHEDLVSVIQGNRQNPLNKGVNDYYVFFSPGATTPIGGCISQPSSGL